MFVANAALAACVGTYTNATNTYHIACPTGWRVTSATVVPNGVALISPTNTTGVIIASVQGEMTASQYTPFLQSYLDKVGATGAKITQSEQQVSAGANTWTEKKATFTKNGTDFTVAQYATVHDGKTYFVEAIAPTANFTAAQSAFQAELASVKFT